MTFEVPNPLVLNGTLSAALHDPGQAPATIVKTTDAFHVHAVWSIDGPAAGVMGGDWHLSAYLESIGLGFEGQIGATVNVPLAGTPPVPLPRNYHADINVAAGAVPAGAYKLVTVLLYTNGGFPNEIAAFSEGPIVQFYDPA